MQGYTQTMKRVLATLLLALVVTLALPALATASNNPCNGDNGQPCRNAPEAPSLLLYPLAAVVVVGAFVLLTRRRRPADQ